MFVVSQPLKKKSKFIIKTEISKDNKPFKCYYTSTSVKSINSSSTQNSITSNLKNIFTPSFSSTIPSINNNINKNIIFNNNNININNINNNNKLNNNLINIDNNNQINFPKKTKRPMFKLNFIKSNNNKHKNKNENKCLFNTNNNNIIINNDINNNNNNFITTINNNNNINKKSKRKSNSNIKYSSGRWKEDEHKRFVEAIIKFGNDWKQVQKYVKTRSSTQARSHAQKFFLKIKKDKNPEMDIINKNSIKSLNEILSVLNNEDNKKLFYLLNKYSLEKNEYNNVNNSIYKKNKKKNVIIKKNKNQILNLFLP